MTWVLLVIIGGYPFRVEGYRSEKDCNAAIEYARQHYYDPDIRTVQGYCIPGPERDQQGGGVWRS